METIGQIYESALGEAPWFETLNTVADLCGAENAALVVADSRLGYSTVVTPRADPDVVSAYADYWWQHDPTARTTASAPVGRLTTLSHTGRNLFLRSPFHNEFWRRSGLGAERVATNLVVGSGMFSSLVLQASKRRDEVNAEMAERFSFCVPHFVKAVNLSRRLVRMEVETAIGAHCHINGCVGIMAVDDAARVAFADEGAEAMLAAGNVARMTGGILNLADPEANSRMRAAITACAVNGPRLGTLPYIRLDCGAEGPPFFIELVPYCGEIAKKLAKADGRSAPVAMLIVHDPILKRDSHIAALRERYGLTLAEAALAIEMLEGDGRAAAARRCNISINTARTHLMSIFEKTGVTRQAELVRILLN